MLDQLTRQDFDSLGDEPLVLHYAGRQIHLVVTESRDLPPISPRAAPFAVVLDGPSEPLLPQAVYQIAHPRRGTLDLFIVPIARDARRSQYELIFN